MIVTLPPGADEWLRTGDRGVSSETIFGHLVGIRLSQRQGPPGDPADLIRCRKLIAAVPDFRSDLYRMADLGPQWRAIVENWDELCATLDRELADMQIGWPEDTYRMMRMLQCGAMPDARKP